MTDPAQENRKLRAAQEGMRSKQKFATGGSIFGLILVGASMQVAQISPVARVVLAAAGGLVVIGSAVPFLGSRCPKCDGRYHGVASLFVKAENAPPCRQCGFDVNRHIPRYG